MISRALEAARVGILHATQAVESFVDPTAASWSGLGAITTLGGRGDVAVSRHDLGRRDSRCRSSSGRRAHLRSDIYSRRHIYYAERTRALDDPNIARSRAWRRSAAASRVAADGGAARGRRARCLAKRKRGDSLLEYAGVGGAAVPSAAVTPASHGRRFVAGVGHPRGALRHALHVHGRADHEQTRDGRESMSGAQRSVRAPLLNRPRRTVSAARGKALFNLASWTPRRPARECAGVHPAFSSCPGADRDAGSGYLSRDGWRDGRAARQRRGVGRASGGDPQIRVPRVCLAVRRRNGFPLGTTSRAARAWLRPRAIEGRHAGLANARRAAPRGRREPVGPHVVTRGEGAAVHPSPPSGPA